MQVGVFAVGFHLLDHFGNAQAGLLGAGFDLLAYLRHVPRVPEGRVGFLVVVRGLFNLIYPVLGKARQHLHASGHFVRRAGLYRRAVFFRSGRLR
ncbi:hypothetical protein D3C80_1788920 [compost metagenome]